MSVGMNGLYFLCAYQQQTCLQPNDAVEGSALSAWAHTGNDEQKWSITPASTTDPELYKIQNLRYQSYLTWPGGNLPQYVIQTYNPIIWCIKEVQTEGNFILISPDSVFRDAWNVMDGSAANNTPIIMWTLDIAWNNSVFSAIPTQRDTFSSITFPTAGLTASSLEKSTSPLASPTGPSSTTTDPTTTTGSSSTLTPSAAPSSGSNGLSLDNKIGLGLGIGFGVPTLLLSIWGIWVSIRIAKGRYEKNKFKPLPSADLAGPGEYYEMPKITSPSSTRQDHHPYRRDWGYTGLLQ